VITKFNVVRFRMRVSGGAYRLEIALCQRRLVSGQWTRAATGAEDKDCAAAEGELEKFAAFQVRSMSY